MAYAAYWMITVSKSAMFPSHSILFEYFSKPVRKEKESQGVGSLSWNELSWNAA